MTDQAILAIDQGTSGTKAIVADDAGTVIGLAEEPLRPVYLAPKQNVLEDRQTIAAQDRLAPPPKVFSGA